MGALNGKQIVIFCGVFLLFVVLLARGDFFGGDKLISEQPFTAAEMVITDDETVSGESPASAVVSRKISSEDRLRILFAALHDGSNGSSAPLELLDEEVLKRVPEYKTKILPYLKIQALRDLLSRVTPAEWTAGKIERPLSSKGGFQSAVGYLNKLGLVHPTLTKFLEAALPEIFELFATIRHGPAGPMKEVPLTGGADSTNGTKLFLRRDASFQVVFEEKRCELTLSFFRANPNLLWEQYQLFKEVDPRFCKKDPSPVILEFILRVIKSASPKLRAEIIDYEMEFKVIRNAFPSDPRVINALSELFVVGALDSVRERNRVQADALLVYSEQLSPGRVSQRKVREMLADHGRPLGEEAGERDDERLLQELLSGRKDGAGSGRSRLDSNERDILAAPKSPSRRSLFPEQVREPVSSTTSAERNQSFAGLIVPLIVFLLAGCGMVFFVVRLKRRFQMANVSPSTIETNTPSLEASQAFTESEMWGDKPDPALGDVTKNRTINE